MRCRDRYRVEESTNKELEKLFSTKVSQKLLEASLHSSLKKEASEIKEDNTKMFCVFTLKNKKPIFVLLAYEQVPELEEHLGKSVNLYNRDKKKNKLGYMATMVKFTTSNKYKIYFNKTANG